VAGEIGGTRFRFGAVWAASMAGAVLLWVAVATLAPRTERGSVVKVDAGRRTLALDTPHATEAGPRSFAVSRRVGVQRFDQSVSLGDVRPGQWVEVSLRTTGEAVPTVTSIRIAREAHEQISARDAGVPKQGDVRCEKAPARPGPSQG
jgi:hypothetical protein